MTMHRRFRTASLAVAVLAVTGLVLQSTAAAARGPRSDRATLLEYATDTWASFEAMVDPATGLPADNISGDLDVTTRSGYTSPTNIGAYLWSTVVARERAPQRRRPALRRAGADPAGHQAPAGHRGVQRLRLSTPRDTDQVRARPLETA